MRHLFAFAFLLAFSAQVFAQCTDGKISLSPTSLDFGTIRIGSTAKQTFQIRNQGTGGMSVTAIISPTSQFVVFSAPALPFCVAAGGSQTITIAFIPSQTGVVNASIGIQGTGGSAVLRVTGTGSPAGQSDIRVSPSSVELGDIPIGTYKQFTLQMSNVGNVLLQVQAFPFDPCMRTYPGGPYSISHGRNKLYLNLIDGTFRDASAGSGANLSDSFTQVIAADYDGDQDLDLFLINHEGPCVLLKNNGKTKFQNVTAVSNLGSAKNATSAAFQDFNGDGYEDLIVLGNNAKNPVFINNGLGKFKKGKHIDLNSAQTPSSISFPDFNDDGSPDAFIGDASGQNSSLYERAGESVNWITVVLEGTTSNRSAIGAKVVVHVGLLMELKVVSGGNGQNQSSLPLEFGLGAATTVDSIQIVWPSGMTQMLANVPANQTLEKAHPDRKFVLLSRNI
jgi:hypothetical protein